MSYYAFPMPLRDNGGPFHGMTMREWYAGQALAGLLSDSLESTDWLNGSFTSADIYAKAAFALADAMLKEANNGTSETGPAT